MKQFFEDFMDMCSSNNTSSRGFYIFLAVMMVLLVIGSLVGIIRLIASIKTGITIGAIIFAVAPVLVLVGLIIWLAKS